ncbi:hypothetical protein MAR_020285 [Mya arenaria]|uniref:DDE Tnp4 domain-containing protein n=1 Tax=Mya arenaria TaxID=6604 RepID=A0ABY7ECN5_MYAAR|nr:hypothetical protein MAR_020285 [Mya arenaria]
MLPLLIVSVSVSLQLLVRYGTYFRSFPKLQEMQKLYLQTKNFPGVCGMIEWSHIPIRRPSDRGIDNYNRKYFYSVVLQAVVAENLRFTNDNLEKCTTLEY